MTNNTFALVLAALLLVGCAADATEPESTAPDPQLAPSVEPGDVHSTSTATVGAAAGASTGAGALGKAAATHPCTVCFGTMGGLMCMAATCPD
jgi:hypothetical protein